MGIPMLNMRRSWDRLIFIMGILMLVRRHYYIDLFSGSHWENISIGSGNSLVSDRHQYFDLRPNKRLSIQLWDWWFETQSWSLWRHCNVNHMPDVSIYYMSNINELPDGILFHWFCKCTPPWMFLPLDIPSEYRPEHVTFGLLCVIFKFPSRIFCRRVPGFATDCPCGVWCRGLTTCLLYVGPPLEF